MCLAKLSGTERFLFSKIMIQNEKLSDNKCDNYCDLIYILFTKTCL